MVKNVVLVLLVLLLVAPPNSAKALFFPEEVQEVGVYVFVIDTPKGCEGGQDGLCFGDYFKILRKSAYVNTLVVPDTIVIHTDDQSGNTPNSWVSTTTWNGLSGRDGGGRSTHFGIGLDGTGQFLPMYESTVVQCRGAGQRYDKHSIQIEMAGRTYDYIVTGQASPEMTKSIEDITQKTVVLVAQLMEYYGISIENVIGHYEIVGSGKSDPGKLYLEEYFMPLLLDELNRQ